MGLGFDDDFDEGFQDRAVLEVDDSIDVDFWWGRLILVESLD